MILNTVRLQGQYRKTLRWQACMLVLVISAIATMAKAEGLDEPAEFHIPAQGLDSALLAFSEQGKIQVVVSTDAVSGQETEGVEGEHTPREALNQLLASTGLIYSSVGLETVAVSAVEGEPPGKVQSTPSAMLMAQASTTNGKKNTKESALLSSTAEDSETATSLDEIIVVGTNIRGTGNPTIPVLQFDRADIDLSGSATLGDFVRTIPQNFNSTTPLANNSGNPFTADSNTDAATIDLRGLGAGATLMLLNGRRMTASGRNSFVDVSSLPLATIDRVEILTDGASAVYGSDAVAGVVNFITRRDYDGLEVGVSYGRVTDGSLEDISAVLAAGKTWKSGGGWLSANFTSRDPLLVGERTFVNPDVANSDGTFFPESERLGFSIGLEQELADRITLGLDGLYSRRDTTTVQSFGSVGATEFFQRNSEVDAVFLNSRLEFEVSDVIVATLFADYGSEKSLALVSSNESSTVGDTDLGNETVTVEGQVSGRIPGFAGGDVGFAVGGQYREESFDDADADTELDQSRDVVAVFTELLIPLFGPDNRAPLIEQLEISLAGRWESYSDVGDTVNPKVGVHWKPTQDVSIRATYSEAFRAPSLSEVFAPDFQTFVAFPAFLVTNAVIEEFDPRLPPGTVATNIILSDPSALTEETADTYSAGITYTPRKLPGLTVSGTAFEIQYSERIETINPLDVLQVPEFAILLNQDPSAQLVQSRLELRNDPTVTTIYTLPFEANSSDIDLVVLAGSRNVSQRDISGFDVGVNYLLGTDRGKLGIDVNAAFITDYSVRLTESSDSVDQRNSRYRPIDFRGRASLSWTNDSVSAAFLVNYTDGYKDRLLNPESGSVGSFTTVDLAFSYAPDVSTGFWSGTRFSLNVQNVLDKDPPFVETIDGLNYDSANASPLGQYVSASIRKTF